MFKYFEPNIIDDNHLSDLLALAQREGIARRTVQRWRQLRKIPNRTYALLSARLAQVAQSEHCELGALSKDWEGWSIRNGRLHSPNGYKFTTGEIQAIQINKQLIAAYEVERRGNR